MSIWIKQSTSVDLPVGPFVDNVDGFTAETALTITQPDVRLKKNGAAWAQKNAAQTLAHEENGWYEVTLDTTDTNTLGQLKLAIAETGALPVWADFTVVPANVYDSLIGGGDALDVSLIQWLGTAPLALQAQRVDSFTGAMATDSITNAAMATDAINAAAIEDGAITAPKLATNAIVASKIHTDVTDEFWAKAMTELAAVPAVTATVLDAIRWLFLLSRNKITQTSTTQTLRNDADSATIGSAAVSDDGTTAIRAEFS